MQTRSLENLREFQSFINGAAAGNETNERFIREFISNVIYECPLPAAVRMAQALHDVRLAELHAEEQN
jgi:hypothetical protein